MKIKLNWNYWNYSAKHFNFSMWSRVYTHASLFMTYKERYNLCMNCLSLDHESLDHVSVTNTTLDFCGTIPRCYRDAYVNNFFPNLARPWNSLSIECFSLTYNLNGLNSRINRILQYESESRNCGSFLKRFTVCFSLYLLLFLVTAYLVLAVQSWMEWIPFNQIIKNWGSDQYNSLRHAGNWKYFSGLLLKQNWRKVTLVQMFHLAREMGQYL